MSIKFLGASVTSFNVNVSFGLEPSELSLTLVEDTKAGDRFSPPPVGEPLFFDLGSGFTFGGFLQSWVGRKSSDGYIYEVKIVDPREFLAGITMIIKGYNGHTGGIHNLFNVYGDVFDRSPEIITDAGIQWKDVLGSFIRLSKGVLRYRNYSFRISLAALPDLPYYYRIGGDTISLLDYVADICDAASLDFHVTFDGTNIQIIPFSRTSQPLPGAIKRFIDSVEGASSKEVGEELRLDTTNKFLLGGKVRQFHFQYSSIYHNEVAAGSITVPTYNMAAVENIIATGTDEQVNQVLANLVRRGASPGLLQKKPQANGTVSLVRLSYETQYGSSSNNKPSATSSSDHNIWPYWGEDANGNLIIGQGYNDDHSFTMNVSDIGIKFGGMPQVGYFTDVAEIRAAGESQESWEAFLALITGNKYKMDAAGAKVGFVWQKTLSTDRLTSLILANKRATDGFHPYDSVLPKNFTPCVRSSVYALFAEYKFNAQKDKKDPTRGYIGNVTEDQLAEKFYNEAVANIEPEAIYSTYRHSGEINIHYAKTHLLALEEVISTDILAKLLDTGSSLTGIDTNTINYKPKTNSGSRQEHEFGLERLHGRLSEMFSSYYGRKFMVRIPFNVTKMDGDITTINTTLMPTDSAPIDLSVIDNAVASKVLPALYGKFITEDGKIQSYIRADMRLKLADGYSDVYTYATLDMSAISPEDVAYSADGSSAFVRSSVDPEIKFINRDVLFGPRAIIELPGQLLYNNQEGLGGGHMGNLDKVVRDVISQRGDGNPSDILRGFGSEALFQGRVGLMAYPIMAAVPLESQINRYGPFYNLNMPGKVEVEIDDSLTPWTFGTYDRMAGAGYAKIVDSLTAQYSSETGSITVPGFPQLSPGSQIVSGGPNITGITCSVADAGILTTYRMSTWTNKIGKLARQYVDTVQKHTTDLHKLKAQLAKRLAHNSGRIGGPVARKRDRPARLKPNSAHAVIGADVKDGEYSVSTLPHYHFNEQAGTEGYENRAFISLDGLFVPVAFGKKHDGDLPKYPYLTEKEASGIDVHCNNLNPYYMGDVQGTKLIAKGTEANEANNISVGGEDVDIRGIGLKAPLILAGWGFDTGGKPAPSSSPSGFTEDYKTNIDNWKVGPLDARWDDERKVWAAGGGAVRIAVSHRAATYNTNQKFSLIKTKEYSEKKPREEWEGDEIDVFNPFASIPSGSVVVVGKDDSGGGWILVSAWGHV